MNETYRSFIANYYLVFGKYLRLYKIELTLATLLLLISVVVIFPIPILTRNIIDVGITGLQRSIIIRNSILLVILLIIQALAGYMSNRIFFVLNSKIILDIRKRLFVKLSKVPIDIFEKHDKGYLYSRIETDPTYIHTLFGQQIVDILKNVLLVIVSLASLVIINARMTLYVLIGAPLYAIILVYYSKKMKRLFDIYLENKANEISRLQEGLRFIPFLKKVNRVIVSIGRYFSLALKSHRINVRYGKYYYSNNYISLFITSLFPIVLLAIGGVNVIDGKITLGTLISFNAFLLYLFLPIQNIINTNVTIQIALAALDRVNEILQYEEEEPIGGEYDIKEIEFKNVNFKFHYNNIVLNNLSFRLRMGQRIGLVGESGSGKTTIINILLGTYPIDSGEIIINGLPRTKAELQSIRNRVALVEQEPSLLIGTVIDNVTLMNKQVNEADIIGVLRETHLIDVIQSMPKSFDTIIGDGHINLSVGQKQRIAIARALLRNPNLIIFDEATSNLDSESEKYIYDILLNMPKDIIIIIIAHRLSTLKQCDNILVLDRGQIIESGRHEDLMRKGGKYSAFCANLQV